MNVRRFRHGVPVPPPTPVAVFGPDDEDDYRFVEAKLIRATFWLSNVQLLVRKKDSSRGAMDSTVGVGELAKRWAMKCWYEVKVYHAGQEESILLDCRAAVVFLAAGFREGPQIVSALERKGKKVRAVKLPGY